ncbi:beta-N-acetylhexosaminidase [Sediminibacillus massiliensis]|uniref:beta-N-acetylhexosaminidase n=1 Tax=Sediminibacillus massiliensis TaxID=1926277 RepID=UPI000988802F|nr:beta-N-acetylhexosaminidase [Sediminibacillus massiliensis]
MNIHFTGETSDFKKGLSILAEELGIEESAHGFPVKVEKRTGPIRVVSTKDGAVISCEKKIHFFRAVGLFLEKIKVETEFELKETPQFDMNGVMIDASRNGVMRVETIRNMLRKMALMGLDVVMLYTEDTYEIKKYPYFGYMRGRYTEEELKDCDEYASELGIEMIPCIQTLAHLTEALKWNYAGDIKDTDDILLVGEEETYAFIKEMIQAASRPFNSKRIHIGMDEAHRLGLGRYLDKHGYRHRFSIMNEHLQRVAGIAEECELRPMIWSDMYFRLGSKKGGYYDLEAEVPKDVVDTIPSNTQLVYWDYYHTDENFYRQFINKHKEFGSAPIFAGGIWTWNGIAPNYGITFATTNAALAACKKTGVKEVFATMWGDNGAETNPLAGLAGMQLFAEHGYAKEVNQEHLAERFSFCVGGNLNDFLALNDFDETPGVSKNNLKESHPSKFLLYQDVLLGLYDQNIIGLSMNEHYRKLAERLENVQFDNTDWGPLFDYYLQLARVLSIKSELGLKLKEAYDDKDRKLVEDYKEQLLPLRDMVDQLRINHRRLWLATNKPFGWEVLDIRYGGIITRLSTAHDRLTDWLGGKIDKIEELEEARLYHDAPWVMPEGALGRNAYHRIVTAGAFSN